MTPRKDTSMASAEVRRFLENPVTGVFTTLGSDGWPHSVAMWFVPAGDSLQMWTYAKSQKARNAARDARASLVVEEGESYGELRGVLVRGSVRLVDDRNTVVQVGRALYERYTQPRTGIPYEDGPAAEVERQAAKRVALILSLDRIDSWDHRKI